MQTTTPDRRAVLIAAAAAPIAACASPRVPFTADEMSVAHPVGFDQNVRVDAAAIAFAPGFQPDPELARREGLAILALSGGGAQGAYGAGVINGWTASGERPNCQVVTGVSTGGLIAPFAFLGPAYDARLRQAFADDPETSRLLQLRGPSLLWKSGVFSARPLQNLIARYADAEFVAAVAREDTAGRRLMIATTALDSQHTTVWNMGAIARRGGPEAVELFQKVLQASASISGVLPPVEIPVEAGGRRFTEMHVDGATTSPFFTVPESLLLWTAPSGRKIEGKLFVILNAQVRQEFRVTPTGPIPVALDSLTTLTNAFARTSLAATIAFCRRNGLAVKVATLPVDVSTGGILDFRTSTMRALFERGLQDARFGKAWLPGLEENWLDRQANATGLPATAAPPLPDRPPAGRS